MPTKIILCADCGCEVIVTYKDGRTKRCKEHQKIRAKKLQEEWQDKHGHEYIGHIPIPVQEGRKRTYLRRAVDSVQDIEYCKANWNSVKGCLNCIIKDCLQPTDNDSFLPWEDEGFYEDDIKIDIELKRSIG